MRVKGAGEGLTGVEGVPGSSVILPGVPPNFMRCVMPCYFTAHTGINCTMACHKPCSTLQHAIQYTSVSSTTAAPTMYTPCRHAFRNTCRHELELHLVAIVKYALQAYAAAKDMFDPQNPFVHGQARQVLIDLIVVRSLAYREALAYRVTPYPTSVHIFIIIAPSSWLAAPSSSSHNVS